MQLSRLTEQVLLKESYSEVMNRLINSGIDKHDVIEYCKLHKKYKDKISKIIDKPLYIDNIDIYFSKRNIQNDLQSKFNKFKQFLDIISKQFDFKKAKYTVEQLYTYTFHKVISYDDANTFIETYFNTYNYPMTWCILGNDQPSKEIYDEYVDKGWKFLFCIRKTPIGNLKNSGYSVNAEYPENYDFICIRKQGNNIYHTLTPNSCPDKPGIPEYLKYYKQYILNF